MEKMKVPSDQYDAVIEKYREQNGYYDMSEEEKEQFDEKLDKVVECSDDSETDSGETTDRDKLREELKERYGYDDMSEEEKEQFDEKLDEVVGTDDCGGNDDDPGENEIGARVLRPHR